MKRTPLAPMSEKRRAQLAATGNTFPTSTFTRSPKLSQPKRPNDTGPTRSVVQLLHARSEGLCEWPRCFDQATEKHHRLNRKAGGRHGVAAVRVNGIEWLIHTCRVHHEFVTSPVGERRCVAIRMGWLLTERQDAARAPVWTRHDEEPVWLLPGGGWARYEEACA